jgi:hydrogenase maturation factor
MKFLLVIVLLAIFATLYAQQTPVSGPECPLCKMVVKLVVENIKKEKKEIIHLLEQQCKKLPAGPQNLCLTIVDVFGEYIIDWIIKHGENPDELCKKLHLCTSTMTSGPECPLCKMIVKLVIENIKKEKPEIIKLLEE